MPTQSNTKRSVDLSNMHSHPFHATSPCICNTICHCMLYHVIYIMNVTWTTQSTPLTECHEQSHHLHMISIPHFIHVNISCKHISTFTFNMSLYDQAMARTSKQCNGHCTQQFITCQYVGVLILTSKQVTTLSSSGTLTVKSCHGHYTHQFITC